ncbi:hypothetical protein [Nannocystis pusilla]|uniref:Peptidase M43 pregnancy-associated plasma-A domain-containing protein n=1 Tax=Nannocystis pusilla TaxID=889268 RepID=A0ABS7TJL6_9BACT|nr:hypothetical protein [Nannocystis pusilla]MBZ5708412.1 hypothetical protein [Nannocystis pusilla]
MARIRTILPIFIASLAFAAPSIASACQARTLCVNWETEIIDNGFGEDLLLEDKVRARGARVLLLPPAPEPPLSTLLDQEGCLTFETQYANGHKLVVFAEAWVGEPDPVRIHAQRQDVQEGAIETEFIWIVDLHNLSPNDVVEFSIHGTALDPIAPLMAVATDVMHRFSELDVLPPAPASMLVEYLDWKGNARGGVAGIELGPDSFREKYLIAHEMGHWLQLRWQGMLGLGDYNFQAEDPDCRFSTKIPIINLMGIEIDDTDANGHGMRSAEWSATAMREGFAHFIAAIAFNHAISADADGIFRYYKDITHSSYTDFLADNSLVSLFGGAANQDPLGGENRWTANKCGQDWVKPETSTGLDWMRFFWHFLTRAGSRPDLRELLEFFNFAATGPYTFDDVNIFPELRDAMGDSPTMSPFVSRFNQANCDMGVFNENTCP